MLWFFCDGSRKVPKSLEDFGIILGNKYSGLCSWLAVLLYLLECLSLSWTALSLLLSWNESPLIIRFVSTHNYMIDVWGQAEDNVERHSVRFCQSHQRWTEQRMSGQVLVFSVSDILIKNDLTCRKKKQKNCSLNNQNWNCIALLNKMMRKEFCYIHSAKVTASKSN